MEKHVKVVIERNTPTTNAYNEEVESWAALLTVYATRRTVSDGERWRNDEISAQIQEPFWIPWSGTISDLSAKDRLNIGGKIYNILGVKEIGRRKTYEIRAAARDD